MYSPMALDKYTTSPEKNLSGLDCLAYFINKISISSLLTNVPDKLECMSLQRLFV